MCLSSDMLFSLINMLDCAYFISTYDSELCLDIYFLSYSSVAFWQKRDALFLNFFIFFSLDIKSFDLKLIKAFYMIRKKQIKGLSPINNWVLSG